MSVTLSPCERFNSFSTRSRALRPTCSIKLCFTRRWWLRGEFVLFQRAEMAERIEDAFATFMSRDEASGGTNHFFYGFNCVRWTRDVRSMAAIQHRQVVVVVTRRKDLVAADSRKSCELLQSGSFAVIFVAKARIDGVAHEVK